MELKISDHDSSHVFTPTCLWLIVVITGAGVDRTITLTVVSFSICPVLTVELDRVVVKSPAVVAFRTDGSTVVVEFKAVTAVMNNLNVLFVF